MTTAMKAARKVRIKRILKDYEAGGLECCDVMDRVNDLELQFGSDESGLLLDLELAIDEAEEEASEDDDDEYQDHAFVPVCVLLGAQLDY